MNKLVKILSILAILSTTMGCMTGGNANSRTSIRIIQIVQGDSTQVERRADGLFYQRGHSQPFTGNVVTYYPDGSSKASSMLMKHGSLLSAKCWAPCSGIPKSIVEEGTGSLKTFYYPSGNLKTKTLVSDSIFKSVEFFDKSGERVKFKELNFGQPIATDSNRISVKQNSNKNPCVIFQLFHPDHAVFEMSPPEKEARWADLFVGPLGITEMLLELPTAIFREENKKGHWKK